MFYLARSALFDYRTYVRCLRALYIISFGAGIDFNVILKGLNHFPSLCAWPAFRPGNHLKSYLINFILSEYYIPFRKVRIYFFWPVK